MNLFNNQSDRSRKPQTLNHLGALDWASLFARNKSIRSMLLDDEKYVSPAQYFAGAQIVRAAPL